MCDDWLAVDQSDGNIERVLPVATDSQIASFRKVFSSSTKKDFSDGHLWFSCMIIKIYVFLERVMYFPYFILF